MAKKQNKNNTKMFVAQFVGSQPLVFRATNKSAYEKAQEECFAKYGNSVDVENVMYIEEYKK